MNERIGTDIESILGSLESLSSFPSIALAVSGGPDSMALMKLVYHWKCMRSEADRPTPEIHVLTVDHGLRPESRHEVQWVKQQAADLGFPAEILRWTGIKPGTSIQEKARIARYRLMAEWCRSNQVPVLLTAHHLNDQAETLLMRLARGSGIDGMAGIPEKAEFLGTIVMRPLLNILKSDLICWLKSIGSAWKEDASNENTDYERVRIRKAIPLLEELGFDTVALARTAERSSRARRALEFYTRRTFPEISEIRPEGYAIIDRLMFDELPEEIGLRCLMHLLQTIGGKGRVPSLGKTENLYAQLLVGTKLETTCAGCVIIGNETGILLIREVRKQEVRASKLMPGESVLWDGRFKVTVTTTAPMGLSVRFLTEKDYLDIPSGFRQRQLEFPSKVSRKIAASLPSLWLEEELVAVPHLGYERQNFPEGTFRLEFQDRSGLYFPED